MSVFRPMSFVAASVALVGISAPCRADEAAPLRGRFEVTGNVALVSDHRSRGLSDTGHGAAIEGGVDLDAGNGWSAGVAANSLPADAGANMELDVYAARSFDVAGTSFAIGATAATFRNVHDQNYGELEISASRTVGGVDATLG